MRITDWKIWYSVHLWLICTSKHFCVIRFDVNLVSCVGRYSALSISFKSSKLLCWWWRRCALLAATYTFPNLKQMSLFSLPRVWYKFLLPHNLHNCFPLCLNCSQSVDWLYRICQLCCCEPNSLSAQVAGEDFVLRFTLFVFYRHRLAVYWHVIHLCWH